MPVIKPIDDDGAFYPYEREANESSPTWHPVEGGHVELAEARRVALNRLADAEAVYAAAVEAEAAAKLALADANAAVAKALAARHAAAAQLRSRQEIVQRLAGSGRNLIGYTVD